MNSRKSATGVLQTVDRLLKSKTYLKSPPPAFYPMLSHPPAPSLVREQAPRTRDDLPQSSTKPATPYQALCQRRDQGDQLTDDELNLLKRGPQAYYATMPQTLTRRNPKLDARQGRKTARPLPIVFAEDQVRRQFFKDHPFEAYRPTSVNERDVVQQPRGPQGTQWTELRQRTIVPTPEDAIAFIVNLNSSHGIPMSQAYKHGLSQFRSLRAEHEMANRAAMLEASSHGAQFRSEIQRGIALEDKVLDEWVNYREIQDRITAGSNSGGAMLGPVAPVSNSNIGDLFVPPEAAESIAANGQSNASFTGGANYLKQFRERTQTGQASGEASS
ncbi:mitochondrial ribosomal small subunit component [Microbotryomycetes sp. JL221]|nr:mitochondrial ribosomal small subunit component [Microbotryomycetes sp. JL221]